MLKPLAETAQIGLQNPAYPTPKPLYPDKQEA